MTTSRRARKKRGLTPAPRARKSPDVSTARKRLLSLLDEGTFQELGLLVAPGSQDFGLREMRIPGDGVIAGTGRIDGSDVCVFSQESAALGGSLGRAHARKICRVMELAYENRVPLIGLFDSGGARVQEGVASLDGCAEIVHRSVKCSGVVPRLSLVLGPCAGVAAYPAALADFVFMIEGASSMFAAGPEAVEAATGGKVSPEELGGAVTHASTSGLCHFLARSESECFRQARELLSYLPPNRDESPPRVNADGSGADPARRATRLMDALCRTKAPESYDVRDVVREIADDGGLSEVMRDYAQNMTTGFIRLGGEVVGVVANNPARLEGAVDIAGSDKASRFVRLLDSFNTPILTLVDSPGVRPGLEQERAGVVRHGAELMRAYSQAGVPKVTFVLRKAYGNGYIAMSSKHLGGDFNFALPCAEIAVMAPSAAVEGLFSKRIRETAPAKREALRAELAERYKQEHATPYQAAANGSLDEVIEPGQARPELIRAFRFLKDKRRPGGRAGRKP
ncbi:MAG: acyl-CoA carboxylase subunit beta [Elusimicrobiota bacterium]